MRVGFAEVVAAVLALLLLGILIGRARGGDPAPSGTLFLLHGAPPPAPVAGDTDADGLPDDWEYLHFGGLYQSGASDPDGDGLTNRSEFQRGTDPFAADSDSDGFADAGDCDPLRFDEGGFESATPIIQDAVNASGMTVFRPI
jgi:hypothetical protein